MKSFGKWSFLVGVLIALFSGYVSWAYTPMALIALGLIVGFLNISQTNAERFLVASIALLVIGAAGVSTLFSSGSLVGMTQSILNNFISFVAAAALVVALKTIVTVGDANEKK
jgi:non-ribosomal peptide synthetase component E (peptide arylation enzyme)